MLMYFELLTEEEETQDSGPSDIVMCSSCLGWWHEGEFPKHQEGCRCSEENCGP